MNSIAYNAKLDQIVLSARGKNEIWFIDHSTTTQGSRRPHRRQARQGRRPDLPLGQSRRLQARHRARRATQPAARRANGFPTAIPAPATSRSSTTATTAARRSIEEIVPPLDASGRYVIEAGKPYGPEKPVWHYEAKNRTDFFSSEISGAHRLPNGNTLICAGVIGHLFEVTPDGEMVWQYVNPVVRGGILAQGELPGKDVRGHLFNAVFKAHRYAPDYPGLKGRDLTPKGVIELPASQKGKTGLDRADASPNERPPGRPGGGPQGPASKGTTR